MCHCSPPIKDLKEISHYREQILLDCTYEVGVFVFSSIDIS